MDEKDREIERLKAELEEARAKAARAGASDSSPTVQGPDDDGLISGLGKLRSRFEASEGSTVLGPKKQDLGDRIAKGAMFGCMGVILLVGGLIMLGTIVSQMPGGTASNTTAPAATSDRADNATAAASAPLPETVQTSNAPVVWNYSQTKDDMRDAATHLACSTSDNRVQLDWPYHPVTAQLCVRKSPRFGTDVYFALDGEGQILCRSYDGCTVKVRFDDGAVQAFSANGPSDNSTNLIFISNAARMIAALKKAKLTRMEIELYQAGVQTVAFPTTGLDWPPKS